MQFKENAEVQTKDGRKVGRIDRVVIDPKTKNVTHMVIKKGFLFTQDKLISVEDVDSTSEAQVVLKKEAAGPDEFPDFEEKHHIPLNNVEFLWKQQREGYARSSVWYYAYPGVAWWGGGIYPEYPKSQFIVKTERNIPPDTVALEEGAKVISADGEHVGNVERIFYEPEEHRVTQLLVSKGMLMREKKLIPTPWVDSVLEEEIRLSVDSELIRDLPVYDVDPSVD
jgi:uncharacterized protein YrrD